MTPVVAVVAPLIIGLLAGLGATSGTLIPAAPVSALDKLPSFVALGERDKSKIKDEFGKTPNYWQLGWTAVLLYSFGVCCYWGLRVGAEGRDDPFPSMGEAMTHWKDVKDMDVRAAVYQIRWRMQKARMGGTEFWNVAYEVIDPILASGATPEAKRAKLVELLDELPE